MGTVDCGPGAGPTGKINKRAEDDLTAVGADLGSKSDCKHVIVRTRNTCCCLPQVGDNLSVLTVA